MEKQVMKRIEMVVPCYNEQDCIRPLYDSVKEVFSEIRDYDWSILYINDGSRDGTLAELKKLKAEVGEKIQFISFSRNFGKESGIYAGLLNSSGDLVVLMDADLQHPPTLIPEMIRGIEEGYDCVGARRVDRNGEPPIRSAFSRMFYSVINHCTSMELVQGGSDFRMMTRQMVDAMLSLGERERFTKGIMSWVGFDTKWIDYENVERLAGESKWSFWGLARYAVSGFMAFATAPLRAVIYFGLVVIAFSILYTIQILIETVRAGMPKTGYASIMIVLLFMSGVIIAILGIIGEYIARIYMELKNRPIFIAKENTVEKDRENKKKA